MEGAAGREAGGSMATKCLSAVLSYWLTIWTGTTWSSCCRKPRPSSLHTDELKNADLHSEARSRIDWTQIAAITVDLREDNGHVYMVQEIGLTSIATWNCTGTQPSGPVYGMC